MVCWAGATLPKPVPTPVWISSPTVALLVTEWGMKMVLVAEVDIAHRVSKYCTIVSISPARAAGA